MCNTKYLNLIKDWKFKLLKFYYTFNYSFCFPGSAKKVRYTRLITNKSFWTKSRNKTKEIRKNFHVGQKFIVLVNNNSLFVQQT